MEIVSYSHHSSWNEAVLVVMNVVSNVSSESLRRALRAEPRASEGLWRLQQFLVDGVLTQRDTDALNGDGAEREFISAMFVISVITVSPVRPLLLPVRLTV